MIKCYYAHPMSLYNSMQEQRDIAELEALGFTVLCPNTPEHLGKAMTYYCGLVRKCQVLAFRALPDGSIPCGIALEIEAARRVANPVIEIPSRINRRTLTQAQTLEFLRESGER